MEWIIGIVAVVVLIIAFVWVTYNSFIKLVTRVDEAWSDITVQLKYRLDLIPNLVNTVKGYATHEKEVFEQVTEARSRLGKAEGVQETAAAEVQMQGAIRGLFAVAEAYPELKASENFQKLQQQLEDTEHKIQAARRFYNAGVRDLNIKIKSVPSNIIANIFNFKEREFFEVDESEREAVEKAPEVKFQSMYQQIASNKAKTWLIMRLFLV